MSKSNIPANVFEHGGSFYEITTPTFKLNKEVYTAAEAAANPRVCAALIEIEAKNIKPYKVAKATKPATQATEPVAEAPEAPEEATEPVAEAPEAATEPVAPQKQNNSPKKPKK